VTPGSANFEEVIFDPSGQNLYAADLANGLIYGFSIDSNGKAVALAGSPYQASPSPSGLAINSRGTQVYVVLSTASEVMTLARSATTGQLSPTGDVVSSGGALCRANDPCACSLRVLINGQ
jgi:6-phosphogluconolactonase (cycloisomerase 2 family)